MRARVDVKAGVAVARVVAGGGDGEVVMVRHGERRRGKRRGGSERWWR